MARFSRYQDALRVTASLAEVNAAATEFVASLPHEKRARIAQRTLTFIPHLVNGTDHKVNDILVRMKLLAAQACAGEIPRGIMKTPRNK
jgi:hypothetical protein